MVGKDKVWDKVEAFIREQGFACDNEHIPVVSRKYRKDVDGLQVVIEPVFTDKGRGRLRFVCTAVAVYEGERHLTGFAWYRLWARHYGSKWSGHKASFALPKSSLRSLQGMAGCVRG